MLLQEQFRETVYEPPSLQDATRFVRLLDIRPTTTSDANANVSKTFRRLIRRERPNNTTAALATQLDHAKELISFNTTTVELSSAPRYAAISYTWGDAYPRKQCVIDNKLCFLRNNAFQALQQAVPKALSEGIRHVWLDAVCINQLDTREKSSQVAMMSSIFSRAAIVYACLGPAVQESATLFEATARPKPMTTRKGVELSNGVEIFLVSFKESLKGIRDGTAHKKKGWEKDFIDRLDIGLGELVNHVYWTRLWILQELYQAKNPPRVLCGTFEADIRNLCAVAYHRNGFSRRIQLPDMHSVFDKLAPKWRDADVLQDVFLGEAWSLQHRRLTELLSSFWHWQCADPRDRVFGLASMSDIPSVDGTIVRPDYEESRIELAFRLILHCDSLHDMVNLLHALHYTIVSRSGPVIYQYWHIDTVHDSLSLLEDISRHGANDKHEPRDGTAHLRVNCSIFALHTNEFEDVPLELRPCEITSVAVDVSVFSLRDDRTPPSGVKLSAMAGGSGQRSDFGSTDLSPVLSETSREVDARLIQESESIIFGSGPHALGTTSADTRAGDYLLLIHKPPLTTYPRHDKLCLVIRHDERLWRHVGKAKLHDDARFEDGSLIRFDHWSDTSPSSSVQGSDCVLYTDEKSYMVLAANLLIAQSEECGWIWHADPPVEWEDIIHETSKKAEGRKRYVRVRRHENADGTMQECDPLWIRL